MLWNAFGIQEVSFLIVVLTLLHHVLKVFVVEDFVKLIPHLSNIGHVLPFI